VQSYEPTNRNSIQGQVSRQVSTTLRSLGFRRYGKCCGCVVKVHVLIWGDLIGMQQRVYCEKMRSKALRLNQVLAYGRLLFSHTKENNSSAMVRWGACYSNAICDQ